MGFPSGPKSWVSKIISFWTCTFPETIVSILLLSFLYFFMLFLYFFILFYTLPRVSHSCTFQTWGVPCWNSECFQFVWISCTSLLWLVGSRNQTAQTTKMIHRIYSTTSTLNIHIYIYIYVWIIYSTLSSITQLPLRTYVWLKLYFVSSLRGQELISLWV